MEQSRECRALLPLAPHRCRQCWAACAVASILTPLPFTADTCRPGCIARRELDEETRTLKLRPMPTAASVRADGAAEGDAVVADERRLDLRVMSQVRVRLVANMTKLPIDYDMELVDTEGWRQPVAAGAAAGAGAEAGGK